MSKQAKPTEVIVHAALTRKATYELRYVISYKVESERRGCLLELRKARSLVISSCL